MKSDELKKIVVISADETECMVHTRGFNETDIANFKRHLEEDYSDVRQEENNLFIYAPIAEYERIEEIIEWVLWYHCDILDQCHKLKADNNETFYYYY